MQKENKAKTIEECRSICRGILDITDNDIFEVTNYLPAELLLTDGTMAKRLEKEKDVLIALQRIFTHSYDRRSVFDRRLSVLPPSTASKNAKSTNNDSLAHADKCSHQKHSTNQKNERVPPTQFPVLMSNISSKCRYLSYSWHTCMSVCM